MREISVYNPRMFALTSAALQSVGLWAIRPDYDTPLLLTHKEWDLSKATDLRLTVAGDAAHPLSRSLAHTEKTEKGVRLWWLRAEPLAQYAGQVLTFALEAEIDGKRLRLAEGEIEVEQ